MHESTERNVGETKLSEIKHLHALARSPGHVAALEILARAAGVAVFVRGREAQTRVVIALKIGLPKAHLHAKAGVEDRALPNAAAVEVLYVPIIPRVRPCRAAVIVR